MRLDWSAFLKVLNESNRVVLTSHVRPDCDALGSARQAESSVGMGSVGCPGSQADLKFYSQEIGHAPAGKTDGGQ